VTVQFVQHWFLPAFIAFAVIMYASAYAGYRIQEDAKNRGLGKAAVTFWSVSVVFFALIALPLYLMFRNRAVFAGGQPAETASAKKELCPHCGEENVAGQQTCSKCHKFMDEKLALLGHKQCPYCGTTNVVDASRCSRCEQLIGIENDDE
jgi:hypothetical protein